MAAAGLSAEDFSTGSWAIAGSALGGPLLGMAIVRRRRHLRRGHVQRPHDELHAPAHRHGWRWPVAARLPAPQQSRSALGQRACLRSRLGARLKLPFERLISIDLILYGSSLILEFLALIFLRLREPELPRPSAPAASGSPACSPSSCGAHRLRALRLALSTLGDPGTSFANVSSLAFAAVVALLVRRSTPSRLPSPQARAGSEQ